MAAAITSNTSGSHGKGYVPELSAATKTSLAKGAAEREAKAGAGNQTGAVAPSTTVNISSAARDKLNAEKSSTQASGGTPQAVKFNTVDEAVAYGARRASEQAAAKAAGGTARSGATSASSGSASTASAAGSSAAAGSASGSNGQPQRVTFNSVDDAIAYGARRANEQAAQKSSAIRTTA